MPSPDEDDDIIDEFGVVVSLDDRRVARQFRIAESMKRHPTTRKQRTFRNGPPDDES